MKKVLLSLFASLFVAMVYAAPTVITEQPEGELRTYLRSGISYEDLWGYFVSNQDGLGTNLVFAADGKTVYWKNPLSRYTKGTWIKGELNADGTKIEFPAGQYVYYDEAKEYGYQLFHIKNVVIDDDYYCESFDIDKDTPIVLLVDGNTLTLEGTTEDGTSIIASVSDDDEPAWNLCGDSQTVLKLFEDTPVTAPEGLQTSTYTFTYGSGSMRIVNVGFNGNEMWIQGIYGDMPEAWMKCTINDDNTVTVNSGQYMGESDGVMLWWVAATTEEEWDPIWEYTKIIYKYADKLTFTYDPESGTYTGDIYLLANNGEKVINRYGTFGSPVLKPYKEIAGTPVDPEIDDFEAPGYDEEWEEDVEGYVTFYIYTKDINGNDIDPDKVYYRLYINDDEQLTLKAKDYKYFTEDMSEFGYSFDDGYDVEAKPSTGKHTVYLYNEFERIGVQVVYRGGGEEHVSNIVYSDGSVTPTSINTVSTSSDAVRTEFFDLSGRRVSKNAPGQIVIKRTVNADGSIRTSKIVNK